MKSITIVRPKGYSKLTIPSSKCKLLECKLSMLVDCRKVVGVMNCEVALFKVYVNYARVSCGDLRREKFVDICRVCMHPICLPTHNILG